MLKNDFISILVFRSINAIFLLSILSCCSYASEKKNIEVMRRVGEYFQNEKSGNWSAVYAMRHPRYRSVVNESDYIKKMNKDHDLFSLTDYSIAESEIRSDAAKFKIKFDYAYLKDGIKKFSVTNYVIWKKIDGEWYCVDAGIRGLFPLNAEIVKE